MWTIVCVSMSFQRTGVFWTGMMTNLCLNSGECRFDAFACTWHLHAWHSRLGHAHGNNTTSETQLNHPPLLLAYCCRMWFVCAESKQLSLVVCVAPSVVTPSELARGRLFISKHT